MVPDEHPVVPQQHPVVPQQCPVVPQQHPVHPREHPVVTGEHPVVPGEYPVVPGEPFVVPPFGGRRAWPGKLHFRCAISAERRYYERHHCNFRRTAVLRTLPP